MYGNHLEAAQEFQEIRHLENCIRKFFVHLITVSNQLEVCRAENNGHSTVTDHRNSICNCQKALLNSHHGCQYLAVTTTS